MIGRVGVSRRLGAILAATPLLIALAFAWQIRPPLPPLPHSLRAPFPAGTVTSALDVIAWLLFVLLDLALGWWVLEFGSQRRLTEAEQRLQQAVRWPPHPKPAPDGPPDWRALTTPLRPPVMRLHQTAAPATATALPPPPTSVQHGAADGDPEDSSRTVGAEPPAGPREGAIGLRLLGPLELVGCKRKQPRRKATCELLAHLAVQQRPVSRDELLEALWPGDDPRRSAERFNQAATEARRLLGESFQRRRDNFYQLNRRRLWIDLNELDQLCKRAEQMAPQEQWRPLERALRLFRGRPFAGIDALWAEAESRRLSALHAELLERIARLRLEAGEATAALAAAKQAGLLDRSNERPVQLAMEAEAALGHRDAIVERYQRLRQELDQQFGLEPSRDTKQLYRRLLSQDPSSSPVENSARARASRRIDRRVRVGRPPDRPASTGGQSVG